MGEKYNGWSSYETWATALWIRKDRETEQYALELIGNGDPENSEELYQAVIRLKEWICDSEPLTGLWEKSPVCNEVPTGLYVDLLQAAFCEINWEEIILSFWDE